ncbi:MAG TPA: SH3 domain-containing protein [Leptospiraceae bacterium]|nr:SH3 domain-containing protein [Leptospiraceae bacterium]
MKIIDSDKSEWSRIQTADGKEGFVNKNFLRVLDGSDKPDH